MSKPSEVTPYCWLRRLPTAGHAVVRGCGAGRISDVNALQNVQLSAMSASSCYLADHEFGKRRAVRDVFRTVLSCQTQELQDQAPDR
jgi:hypothetical protein